MEHVRDTHLVHSSRHRGAQHQQWVEILYKITSLEKCRTSFTLRLMLQDSTLSILDPVLCGMDYLVYSVYGHQSLASYAGSSSF